MAINSMERQQTQIDCQSPRVIVVTGAGGIVGRQLLHHLTEQGDQVRLLSRDPQGLIETFGRDIEAGSYDEMESLLANADAVVHLAARNNDQGGDLEEFHRDNVDLTMRLANAAKQRGVKRFIFATTTKALTDKGGHYGQSKATAELRLAELNEASFRVTLARLCPVYGEGTRGKIKHLQNLPLGLGSLALWLVRSLVPIVSSERVADGISKVIDSPDPLEEICLSNPLGMISVYHIFTAIMNFVFVILVPTLLGIPCLIAAIAVAVTSKGGAFFIQKRVGRKQNPFPLVKFRTMFTGAPVAGTHEVGKSYVTKVGSFLRKSKMDELPQAWNVLLRQLNLIGPRPCLEKQTELVHERERYGVFNSTPGITGFGQVAGVDMSEPRKLAIYDHRYAAFRGILLDVKIAMKTVLGGGFGDPAGGDTASANRQESFDENKSKASDRTTASSQPSEVRK